MSAISENGTILGLGQCQWWANGKVSPDGRYVVANTRSSDSLIHNFVYDLQKDNLIAEIPYYAQAFSISPNGEWVVGEILGEEDDQMFLGVGVVSVRDKALYFLTQAPDVYYTHFTQFTWSPDGKWLAYVVSSIVGEKSSRESSLNLLDVSCLNNPVTCTGQTARVLSKSTGAHNYEFSPDSHYLAGWNDDYVVIYNLLTAQKKVIYWVADEALRAKEYIQGMTWFPNRNQLAVSSFAGDIYLLSPESGEKVLFKEKAGFVKAWLTILPPFAPGLELAVSQAGHDLNLRAEPSLEGAVLRQLAPGTRLIILEGPVEAGGYPWWKMQTGDGSEGWAVEVGVWYQAVSGE